MTLFSKNYFDSSWKCANAKLDESLSAIWEQKWFFRALLPETVRTCQFRLFFYRLANFVSSFFLHLHLHICPEKNYGKESVPLWLKKIEGTFLPLWYSKYFPHSKFRNTFEVCDFALHVLLLYLPIVRSPFKTCLAAQCTASEVTPQAFRSKNTIRDGGSTALYTAFTVYTVCTVWHCFHCLYYSNCLSLLKQKHVFLSILFRNVRTL